MRVADKEGVLRFVGNVHFSQGVWCGIELCNGKGKNDGCVRGVQYFTCPNSCGLMVPLWKVLFADDVQYEDDDCISSGPHSILFGIQQGSITKDLQRIDLNTNYVKNNESSINTASITNGGLVSSINSAPPEKGITVNENKNTELNETFILNRIDEKKVSKPSRSCSKENPLELCHNITYDLNNSLNVASQGDSDTSFDSNVAIIYDENPKVNEDRDRRKNPIRSNVICLNENELQKSTKCPEPILYNISKVKFLRLTEEIEIENSPRRRVRASPALFNTTFDEESTKRDSLEFEESLGILTPEQMGDITEFACSKTPSSENIQSLPNDLQNLISKFQCEVKSSTELGSPNLMDASVNDISLGILDEHVLSNLTMKSDTTMNMELPLDSVGNRSKSFTITRLEQTPSPEDLPLDPTPVIENEPKTEPTKSKTSSSFITSITSITSLDTGYQGDGEMSRPASRGPDHSPLTRRPIQRPQPRRPDPMTDSDFYTESDADNHEEHPLRGGRLARVIDGTLYGVDPQAAADIYVNNRENMDSSGIFTDIEGNTRNDELSSADNDNHNENLDVSPSPSDTSSKTISNDSQNNVHVIINKTPLRIESNNNTSNSQDADKMEIDTVDLGTKRMSPSPSSVASSPASLRSPRHTPRDDTSIKKYKMPKRNVASKVKAVLESTNQQNKELARINSKKPVGRWDAVMNKISKTPVVDKNFKEIKSKVFASPSSAITPSSNPISPNNKT